MANFYHYLKWRGDLSFAASPLNEVDALILSWLAYADLKDYVKGTPDPQGDSIKDIADAYFAKNELPDDINFLQTLNPPLTATVLLKELSECERFKDLLLTYWVDDIDYENPRQFSAMTVILPEHQLFIGFRGTDRSFVGWQEDFYMTCMDEIPSQHAALDYLKVVAAAFPRVPLLIGGHSKGGNMAAFACINAGQKVRNRVKACYNNDGPGLTKKVLASKAYLEMRDRIHKFVPQASVVGILFDSERDYRVIKSAQSGFFQHNGPFWEVMGTGFVPADNLLRSAEAFDESLNAWLIELDHEKRRSFIDALFSIFEKSDLKTFDDIGNNKIKSLLKIVRALSEVEPQMRTMIAKTLFGLFRVRTHQPGQSKDAKA